MSNSWLNNPVTVTYDNNFSSKTKASNTIITKSDVLLRDPEYLKVKSIIEGLIESGLGRMGEGYCISVSDIVFNFLNQNRIKSHLLEVQLSAVDNIENKTYMVGFDTAFQQNSHLRVSTHVVVVTDTKIPMIIDLSISHRLPHGYQCIIDKAINEGDKVICKVEHEGWTWIYQEKKNGVGVPMLHQISILERIATDKKLFDSIKALKTLNIIGITLSTFAVLNVLGKFFIDWYN